MPTDKVHWNFQFNRYQRYMNTCVYICISDFTYASGRDKMLISAIGGSELEMDVCAYWRGCKLKRGSQRRPFLPALFFFSFVKFFQHNTSPLEKEVS